MEVFGGWLAFTLARNGARFSLNLSVFADFKSCPGKKTGSKPGHLLFLFSLGETDGGRDGFL